MGLLQRWRNLVGIAEYVERGSASFEVSTAPYIQTVSGVVAMADAVSSRAVSRDVALTVPAVLRARNSICAISTLPLIELDKDNKPVKSPWLDQVNSQVPNVVTIAQTIEDLLFDSVAWWQVTSRYGSGYPGDAKRVDPGLVTANPPAGHLRLLPSGIDPSSVLWVDGEPVSKENLIRFDSPNPPLLVVAKKAIRRAAMLESSAEAYADGGASMLDYFTPAEGADPVGDDEIEEILDEWRSLRRDNTTGYVPAALVYNTVDRMSPADLQLRQLQDRAALDLANATGLDPEEMGINTTSRVYQNATDRRKDKINDLLSPYMVAITQRLSMGDCTVRGHRTSFDMREYLRADPITRATVNKIYYEMGAVTIDEIRSEDGRPPLPEDAKVKPAEQPQNAGTSPDQQGEQVKNSGNNSLKLVTLSDPDSAVFEFEPGNATLTTFAVNESERTITGLAIPFNVKASNGRGQYLFRPGSINWADVSRVKMLRGHNSDVPIGVAVSLTESADGIMGTFRMSSTPAAQEALTLAKEGILDGLSVGVRFAHDSITESEDGTYEVTKGAHLREVSLTPTPAFDDSRLSAINASWSAKNQGSTKPEGNFRMDPCKHCGVTHPATVQCTNAATPAAPAASTTPATPAPAAPAQFEGGLTQFMEAVQGLPAAIAAGVVAAFEAQGTNDTPVPVTPLSGAGASFQVNEPHPYRFNGPGEFDLSTDLFSLARQSDGTGDARTRVQEWMKAEFSDGDFAVTKSNVVALNPTGNRPDMWVDQLDYSYPLWDAINKGGISDATPFTFPKFNSAAGLVGDHTEGVEPTPGSYTATNQTVTPGPVSGKIQLTRETLDQGGNPQVSQLIRNQIRRAYKEALEAKAAALLTSSAPAVVTITTAVQNAALATELRTKLGALQLVRGGFTMRDLFLTAAFHGVIIAATDSQGRPMYPQITPINADGRALSLWGSVDLGGVIGYPAWALPTSAINSSNSYLFNRGDVHGWASAPMDLRFEYQVATIDLGVWGYVATAISDLNGVRALAYDPQ